MKENSDSNQGPGGWRGKLESKGWGETNVSGGMNRQNLRLSVSDRQKKKQRTWKRQGQLSDIFHTGPFWMTQRMANTYLCLFQSHVWHQFCTEQYSFCTQGWTPNWQREGNRRHKQGGKSVDYMGSQYVLANTKYYWNIPTRGESLVSTLAGTQ